MTAPMVPPHDRDAERAVLSAMLCDPDAIDLLAPIVPAEALYVAGHAQIREAIGRLVEASAPVDALTVLGMLRELGTDKAAGGAAYLADLTDATPTFAPKHLEAYAETIRSHWRVRRMIATCRRIAADGYDVHGDVRAWLERAEADVFAVAVDESQAKRSRRVGPIGREYIERIQANAQSGRTIAGIRTGFAALDATTMGMHRGDLWIVAGRPGMGKSALAQALAQGMAGTIEADDAQPIGSLYVSAEMPDEQIAMRAIASEGHVDMRVLRGGGRIVRDDEWAAIGAGMEGIYRLPMWVYDVAAPSLLDVRSEVRRVRAEAAKAGINLSVVVVDYLQLMRGTGREGSREQEISGLSRGLKAMAKELGVVVIALSQLSRKCEERKDRRPMLSDLRESGAIEQDADVVLLLYRDAYYDPETDAKNVVEINVAKQRNGPTGVVEVFADMTCGAFRDLSDREGPR